jgi:drug/metabolite transporter (DMT)-like permease
MATSAQPLWPFALPIIGFVSYSLILKTLRPDVHPLLFLSIAYAVAFVLATVIWMAFGDMGSKVLQSGDVIWAGLLGLALVTIEFGFLLTLRNGWPVGIASTAINVATATILVAIGVAVFQEKLSAINITGAALCIGGLVLMTRK